MVDRRGTYGKQYLLHPGLANRRRLSYDDGQQIDQVGHDRTWGDASEPAEYRTNNRSPMGPHEGAFSFSELVI